MTSVRQGASCSQANTTCGHWRGRASAIRGLQLVLGARGQGSSRPRRSATAHCCACIAPLPAVWRRVSQLTGSTQHEPIAVHNKGGNSMTTDATERPADRWAPRASRAQQCDNDAASRTGEAACGQPCRRRSTHVRAACGAARRAARAPSSARIACHRSCVSSASPWLSASSRASCGGAAWEGRRAWREHATLPRRARPGWLPKSRPLLLCRVQGRNMGGLCASASGLLPRPALCTAG